MSHYAETVSVSRNSWHPNYNKTGHIEDDIAVLTLARDVTWNNGKQPVCAPAGNDVSYNASIATVSGWGTTSFLGPESNYLRATNIPIIPSVDCAKSFPSGMVTDDNVCAGHQGANDRAACSGDSGGPLAVKNRNGQFEIVGIVSWGEDGCAGKTPGVYAQVHYFMDWIKAQL